MSYAVCAVDESGSDEAVRAAIDFCLEHDAGLRLVGIVKDKLTDSTRSTAGERVRRYKTVKLHLDIAADAARRAGVVTTTTVRAGDLLKGVLAEADAVGSGELFFVRSRGRIRAAISRKPRKETAPHVWRLHGGRVGEGRLTKPRSTRATHELRFGTGIGTDLSARHRI